MFTLGGFGGATSLCIAEAIASIRLQTAAPHDRAQVLQREALGCVCGDVAEGSSQSTAADSKSDADYNLYRRRCRDVHLSCVYSRIAKHPQSDVRGGHRSSPNRAHASLRTPWDRPSPWWSALSLQAACQSPVVCLRARPHDRRS